MAKRRICGILLSAAVLPLLIACGGGGSSTPPVTIAPPPAPPPPPPPTTNTWVQGQFAPAAQFKNLCEAPRTGNDITGTPFPDQSGTLSDELFWLRSWSNETYLWYDEITDRNPNSFSNPLTYFDELKTTATTPSGAPKDQFHFTVDSEEWLQQRTTGASGGYGAQFALISTSPPRDIRIAFVEANGPAAAAGIERGDKILTIDGVDVRNGSDTGTLNAGLFPANSGEDHVFVVESVDGTSRTVTLRSALVEADPVNELSVFESGGRKYGYVHFTTFSPFTAEKALFDAFDTLQTEAVDDVVLDLRYNGGGLLAVASQLSYMIAGPDRTNGLNFETLQFNDKAGGINPVTGQPITPTPFLTRGQDFTVPPSRTAPTVSKPRVFVLTTDQTCSASEAVMNGLRGIDVEVIQIGGRTCGKPYGFYATDNCGTTFFTIQFRGVNAKNFGDYADGFAPGEAPGGIAEVVPGCSVADDLDKKLGDPTEAMLSAAITYAETGSCPAGTTVALAKAEPFTTVMSKPRSAQDLMSDPRVKAREIARTFGQER